MDRAPYSLKIKGIPEVVKDTNRRKARGERIVFTNGCFDLLHPGHTQYLHSARELGDCLIVGLNSDRSVRSIKGPNRPIFPQEMRAELLASLGFVDTVVIFDQDDPLMVIKQLLPHVLVKGGDWPKEEIIGADVVEEAGGVVMNIPYIQGYSTTALIKRIVDLCAER